MINKFTLAFILVITLYFIYSATFTTDYLMNDEWEIIGRDASLFQQVKWHGLSLGRPLYGFYRWNIYQFAEYSPTKIQFVRFINWAGIAGFAVTLYLFLQSQNKKPVFSFFVVLFYFTLLPWQGLMGYSLQTIGITLPVIFFSLTAFFLHGYVWKERRIGKWFVTFILLLLAMQSAQTNAFFAVVPLSYLILADWEQHKSNVISFLVICGLVFIISTIAYKIGVDYQLASGGNLYPKGGVGLSSLLSNPATIVLNALNPLFYWSVFKIWSFPFPFHAIPRIPESTRQIMAGTLMILWLAALLATFRLEFKRDGIAKWLALLACLGLGAIIVVADSPTQITDHRPHVTLVMSGVVVFSFAYAIEVLAQHYPIFTWSATKIVAVGLVIFLAFGAQSNVYRGLVLNHADMITFMRTELSAKSAQNFDKVMVLLPRDKPKCLAEPCGQWFGLIVQSEGHLTRPAIYNYALATIGINPDEKTIEFVDRYPDSTDDSVVINWRKYVRSQISN